MDPQAFAAERWSRLENAERELRPSIERALRAHGRGEDDWDAELLVDLSALWLEIFEREAPDGNRGLALARFRRELRASFVKTTRHDELDDAQVNRFAYWLAGYVTNSAQVAAAITRGVRYKRWITKHDDDVRDAHVITDGQIVPIGGTFDVAGHNLHYPGEPVGPPEVWINCRCLAQPAARDGEAMSSTTYVIGPDDEVEDENPDIVVGEKVALTAAASEMPESDEPEQFPEDEGDMVPDEPDEDEELITEIPVHGVLAPEGIPTGDGRMFAKGALSTRPLPVPLRYETVGTHGGDTSMVVTVGRIDEAWRDEASDMWRFRGALVLTRQYAQEVIDGIVDGTIRGVSIDGDDAEVEMPEVEDDGEGIMEVIFDPGVTTFTRMRIAGLTIVPIPAFHEAYIALGHDFAEDMSEAELADARTALAACGCLSAPVDDVVDLSGDDLQNWRAGADAEDGAYREISAEERKRLAEEGKALPDGSFPIANCEDLRNAIQANGRASDIERARAHIKKRARELDCPDIEIPENWALKPWPGDLTEQEQADLLAEIPELMAKGLSASAFVPGTKDGPGWITHPVPTARIRRYWVRGEGAAKIRWGAPGDFNRCRRQLAKYVQNPDWLAGLCANMHYEALGFWPSQHGASRAETHRALVASGARVAPIARLVAAPVTTEVYKREWFDNPGLDHAEPLTIEGNRIYGYIAEWGTCHVGVAGICEEVPQTLSDYGYFRKGIVDTDQGPVAVGCITYGVGHPSEFVRAEVATAHYDKTDAIRAYVNVGEDAHGIWFAGVLAPWVTDEDIAAMRAIGSLSGDWRAFAYGGNLELIAAVVVPVPGYQLRRSLVASGGHQTALIAAGRVPAKASARHQFGSNVVMDPEMVAAIARTAVDEYRHAERVEARATPARETIRAHRLAAARERVRGA